jgi:hypothetical protein
MCNILLPKIGLYATQRAFLTGNNIFFTVC